MRAVCRDRPSQLPWLAAPMDPRDNDGDVVLRASLEREAKEHVRRRLRERTARWRRRAAGCVARDVADGPDGLCVGDDVPQSVTREDEALVTRSEREGRHVWHARHLCGSDHAVISA